MNDIHAYYSILNRYSVYDLEALLPSLTQMYDAIHAYYVSLDGLERTKKQDLKAFLIVEVYSPESKLSKASEEFVAVSNKRFGFFEHGKKLPEPPRVFPAIVALNGLYSAASTKSGLEDALHRMYMNGYFVDIIQYCRALHDENNNENTRNNRNNKSNRTKTANAYSQRSVSVGSNNSVNSGNSHLTTVPVSNEEGAFGPMNAGKRKTMKRKVRRTLGRKGRFTRSQ